MKYTEYVTKITETVNSLEVQLKRRFLHSCIRSSAVVSFFTGYCYSFKHIQHLAFVELLALGLVYSLVLVPLFSIICHNDRFSHVGSHIIVSIFL